MSLILGYTVYRRDVASNAITIRGVESTKDSAWVLMTLFAEEYCINKVGIDNFLRGQLDNPASNKSMRDGFALSKSTSNPDEIRISRRTPSSLWGYAESEVCVMGVLPIVQDQVLVHSADGTRQVVQGSLRSLQAATTTTGVAPNCPEQQSAPTEEDVVQQQVQRMYNKNKIVGVIRKQSPTKCGLIEALAEELSVEIEKRRAKLMQTPSGNSNTTSRESSDEEGQEQTQEDSKASHPSTGYLSFEEPFVDTEGGEQLQECLVKPIAPLTCASSADYDNLCLILQTPRFYSVPSGAVPVPHRLLD